MIISVSRRSDIPRYYWDWFLDELKRGEIEVANPFNAHQKRIMSLLPEDVDGLVFWTRDPHRIAESAEYLHERGYHFYVMVTITAYPPVLEPHAPPLERVFLALHRLKNLIGAGQIFWRYDPIMLTSLTTASEHERQFCFLAKELQDTVGRCIISFYDPYIKCDKRLRTLQVEGKLSHSSLYAADGSLSLEAKLLAKKLADTAHQYGIPIYSCAEPDGLTHYGIKPHACIDGRLFGLQKAMDPHQRTLCQCDKSVDVGKYGTCPAHCVYCYAW